MDIYRCVECGCNNQPDEVRMLANGDYVCLNCDFEGYDDLVATGMTLDEINRLHELLNKAVDNKLLIVFNHNLKTLDTIRSWCLNGNSIQLNF